MGGRALATASVDGVDGVDDNPVEKTSVLNPFMSSHVSMSGNGKRVCVGSPGDGPESHFFTQKPGYVSVYEWTSTDSTESGTATEEWVRMGDVFTSYDGPLFTGCEDRPPDTWGLDVCTYP